MKNVMGISLGSSSQDFDFETSFLGQTMRVRRQGTDGSLPKAIKLLKQSERQADAIGLGLVLESAGVGRRVLSDAEKHRLAASRVPLTTGERLGEIFLEWALRRTQAGLGHYFDNAKVLFFSGLAQHKLAMAMAEFSQNLQFADPLRQLGLPKLLGSIEALDLYASGAHHVFDWLPPRVIPLPLLQQWSDHVLRRAMQQATVLVAPVHEFDGFGLEELAGKTLVTSTVNDERLASFKDRGVHLVVDGSPVLAGHVLGPALLDAMIIAATAKRADQILEDDYLEIIAELQLEPRLLYPNGFKRVNRFAFVIHPLSQEYFKAIKPIELLSRVSPPLLMDSIEKVMAYAPPFVYSRVEGIRSPSGVEAEGWLISVGGTPREIMGHSPEFTYRRLLAAARMAKRLGAQIMGLGAFTKVVGDAGVCRMRMVTLPRTAVKT